MKTKLLAALAAVAFAFACRRTAQRFPDRPMTMVIPFAAGGPTDVLGRVVAGRMSEVLGQNVIVENVGGAGGMTGSARVANAAPDGYQFVLGTVGTHAQGQTLYKHPLYNAVTDFTPVDPDRQRAAGARDAQGSAGQQFQGIRRLRQGEPGEDAVRLGRRRLGDASRLRAAELHASASMSLTCPIAAPAPALQDLEGGRIDYLCDVITTAKPPIDGGAGERHRHARHQALAGAARTCRPRPNKARPTSSPIPGTRSSCRRTRRRPIVKKLHDAALEAMHTPAVRDRLTGLGAEIVSDERSDAAISRRARQERDREVGGADQGQRRQRRIARVDGTANWIFVCEIRKPVPTLRDHALKKWRRGQHRRFSSAVCAKKSAIASP